MKKTLFLLLVLVAVFSLNDAFADHTEVTIEATTGSGTSGCEETAEGCYIPSTATVDVGGVVIFSNPDSAAHTFTSSDGNNVSDGVFDSGLAMAGSTYEWSPTEAGEQDYFCMVHPWMQGLIIVQEAEAQEDEGSTNIEINTTKLNYDLGDSILVLGETGANQLITISLIDPNGNEIQIKETYSDGDGKISDGSLRVPSDAMPGTWEIKAQSGSHFDIAEITVGTVNYDEFTLIIEEGQAIPGLGDTIAIKVFGAESNIEIEIVSESGEIIGSLDGIITSAGTVDQLWAIPNETEPGTYTVSAYDVFNSDCALFDLDTLAVDYDCVFESTHDPEPTTLSLKFSNSVVYEGNILELSGNVYPVTSNDFLSLVLLNENNETILVTQIDLNSDGSYSFSTVAEGTFWKESEIFAEVTYDGLIAEDVIDFIEINSIFTPIIVLADSSEVDYYPLGEYSNALTWQKLKPLIENSNDYESYLQDVLDGLTNERNALSEELENTPRYNSDGTETQEYIDAWVKSYVYNRFGTDYITPIFDRVDQGMSLQTVMTQLDEKANYAILDYYNAHSYQVTELEIDINKSTYNPGETILVNGETLPLVLIRMELSGDNYNESEIILYSDSDGKFSYTYKLSDNASPGTGIFEAESGDIWATAEFTVNSDDSIPNPDPDYGGDLEIVSLSTKKSQYVTGDTIVITGKVNTVDFSKSVVLQVFNRGNLVDVSQVSVSLDESFSKTIIAEGPLWMEGGKYVVKASYEGDTKETSFVYRVTDTPIPETEDEITIVPTPGSGAPGCEDTSQGCYLPSVASVSRGGVVLMKNTDTAAHTFTSGSPTNGPDSVFDSGLVMVGSSYEWTPEDEGVHPYFCMVHPWMTGVILVGEGTTPPPKPHKDTSIDLEVSVNERVYDLDDLVGISVEIDGISGSQKVAVAVTDPRGNSVVSRSLTFTSDDQVGEIEFRISDDFKTGTYKVTATTSEGKKTVKDTAHFKIKSQYNSFKITSVEVTDQQGNPSDLEAGEIGFIKVNLKSNKSIATLVTVNLFDSELTSIGIGSVKTTLSSGNSEIILSFMIPADAAIGPADIYVNAFSDWPSNGGIPLTGEVSTVENIQ